MNEGLITPSTSGSSTSGWTGLFESALQTASTAYAANQSSQTAKNNAAAQVAISNNQTALEKFKAAATSQTGQMVMLGLAVVLVLVLVVPRLFPKKS